MTALVVPWRPTSPERVAAYELTLAWYRHHLPDAQVVLADSGHDVWNLAASRNVGVADAVESGHRRIVITDADTIPPPRGLALALKGCRDGRLHYPFDRCLYAGTDGQPGRANGGVFVVSAAGWAAIGGQDERFTGWGGEDDQLVAAATCLTGVVRHPGIAVSYWHPPVAGFGTARHAANLKLLARYTAAKGSSRHMRRLIAERATT